MAQARARGRGMPAAALGFLPVSLFSGGPIGIPPPDATERRLGDELAKAIGPATPACLPASSTARA